MEKHGDSFVTVSADRAVMPDYKWVFNFHAIYSQEVYGKINSPEAFEKAVTKVKDYNDKNNDSLCSIIQNDDGEVIVAVCDSLSRRVHKVLPQAGDIVYVDATSNLDRQDSKLVKFMTCSPAGGLPLGFVVTSSESEKVLTEAFTEFKRILPDDAFAKRGKEIGPTLFMTDDANAEINALRKVWPTAKLLLCVWHVLNAVWRWLWDNDHKVKKDDRPYLLKKFRKLLYAKTTAEYGEVKEDMLKDAICLQYPNYIKHLDQAYLHRKEVWAISVRNEEKLPTHSTNTSNFVEASFRITKDVQFNRTKAYNLADLLEILLDESVYYKKRLLDIGNGRFGAFKHTKSRYLFKKTVNIREDQIFDIGESNYIVQSEKNPEVFYHVNMFTGSCECKAGANCGPCKHKKAIATHKGVAEFSVLPEFDAKARGLYHYIAEATLCKDTWYRDLEKPEHLEHVSDYVNSRVGNSEMRGNDDIEIIKENVNEIVKEEDSEDETEEDNTLENFVEVVDIFKNKIVSSYGEDLKKGLKYFTKHLAKLAKGTKNTLKNSLFDIGKELNKARQGGRKKKNSKHIPIQVTAKSRRTYKHRGRTVGVLGRRPKDQEARRQLVIDDADENVYHSLPKQKLVKRKPVHSLKVAIEQNKPGTKKH